MRHYRQKTDKQQGGSAKLPPFVCGLYAIGLVLLLCFALSCILEALYCKNIPNGKIKLAACLVLDAFAFLLPGVVAAITAVVMDRKNKRGKK